MNKKGLTAFILGCVALFVLWPCIWVFVVISFVPYVGSLIYTLIYWVSTIAGLIIAAVALGTAGKAKGVQKQPYKIFRTLGTVFGAVALALFILRIICRIISWIIVAILVAILVVLAIIAVIGFIALIALAIFTGTGPLVEYLYEYGIAVESSMLLSLI